MANKPFWQATEDWHTAGEPFRIVQDLPEGSLTPGLTIWEQRARILSTPSHPLDLLRQSLCHEPRGHADMYGGFILPPNDEQAHLGVLFFHCDGFSTACGHGTIALGHWAVHHGLVKSTDPDGEVDVVVDVPSGRVVARVHCAGGKAVSANFINVASYQVDQDRPLQLTLDSTRIDVMADISFGGAIYVSVNAKDLNLEITPRNSQLFINLQRQVKVQLSNYLFEGRYEVYGVCFFEDISQDADRIEQRNVVVFADGQIDRSPCGSGTAARVAILLQQGRLTNDNYLIHHSIIGTTFEARVISHAPSATSYRGCVPSIRGSARLVARSEFYIDLEDDIYPGFVRR